MKTYKIPISWEVAGEVEIEAENIDEAVRIVELNDIPYPSIDYNIDGSVEVNYDIIEELNDGEKLSEEPPFNGDSLTCPDCGCKGGKHYLSCSVWGGKNG
jgi:hypothetical protein